MPSYQATWCHFQKESNLQVINLYYENRRDHINVGKKTVKKEVVSFRAMKAYKGVEFRFQTGTYPEFFIWRVGVGVGG